MSNPAALIFTEDQARAFNREVTAATKKLTAGRDHPAPPKPVVISITTVDEAIQSRLWAESQNPTPVQNLADNDAAIFDLTNRIEAAEALLPTATESEKRLILGYEERDFPSLPGIKDTYHHVPGSVEVLKEKRAALEEIRPALQRKAEHFLAVMKALEPWPTHRVARIRNEAVERQLIAKGKPVQRRGSL